MVPIAVGTPQLALKNLEFAMNQLVVHVHASQKAI
jgi:hypothetical protein